MRGRAAAALANTCTGPHMYSDLKGLHCAPGVASCQQPLRQLTPQKNCCQLLTIMAVLF